MDLFLIYLIYCDLCEKVWIIYYSCGDNGDEFDNNVLVKCILELCYECIKLLGYENYVQWCLEDCMVKMFENVMDLMMKVWLVVIVCVEEEVVDMQVIVDELGDDIIIKFWDYCYYVEKVCKVKYDLDFNEVK